jgi:hypothetical protein
MNIIYLDQFRKMKVARTSAVDVPLGADYVADAAIASVRATFCVRGAGELSPQLPDHVASADLDRFLERVRSIASML